MASIFLIWRAKPRLGSEAFAMTTVCEEFGQATDLAEQVEVEQEMLAHGFAGAEVVMSDDIAQRWQTGDGAATGAWCLLAWVAARQEDGREQCGESSSKCSLTAFSFKPQRALADCFRFLRRSWSGSLTNRIALDATEMSDCLTDPFYHVRNLLNNILI